MFSLFLKAFVFFAGAITSVVAALVAGIGVGSRLPGVTIDAWSMTYPVGADWMVALTVAVALVAMLVVLALTVAVFERLNEYDYLARD